MYILGIDSSAGRVSVAINCDRQLLSKIEYDKNQKFMVSIIYLIDRSLKKAGISLDLVDLFAVNIGPGDFTGTRIGMSVAKTLAWLRSKPVCGIESLDITALGIFHRNLKKVQKLLGKGKQIILAPVLDVKRNEVFFSFYKMEESSLDITGDRLQGHIGIEKLPGFKVSAISRISIQNKDYYLNKVSGSYLAETTDFAQKFNSLFVPDNSFSTYALLGGSGFSNYKHLEPEVSNDDFDISIFLDKRLPPPDAFHLNLCAYYRYLKNRQESTEKVKSMGKSNLRDSKAQGSEVQNGDIPKSDTNSLLADYSLAPLYVREFTPFKK